MCYRFSKLVDLHIWSIRNLCSFAAFRHRATYSSIVDVRVVLVELRTPSVKSCQASDLSINNGLGLLFMTLPL